MGVKQRDFTQLTFDQDLAALQNISASAHQNYEKSIEYAVAAYGSNLSEAKVLSTEIQPVRVDPVDRV